MQIHEIREMPTTVAGDTKNGVHESCLRSYQILMKVKYLLQNEVPPHIILELMEEMDALPHRTLRLCNGERIIE